MVEFDYLDTSSIFVDMESSYRTSRNESTANSPGVYLKVKKSHNLTVQNKYSWSRQDNNIVNQPHGNLAVAQSKFLSRLRLLHRVHFNSTAENRTL